MILESDLTPPHRCPDGRTCLSLGCGHQRRCRRDVNSRHLGAMPTANRHDDHLRRHGPGRIVTFGWYSGGPQQTVLIEDGER